MAKAKKISAKKKLAISKKTNLTKNKKNPLSKKYRVKHLAAKKTSSKNL